MDSKSSKAEKKVWSCPEILARFLRMFDPLTIKKITQSGIVKEEIFERSLSSKIWAGILKRHSYMGGRMLQVEDDVLNLLTILRYIQPKEPQRLLLPLVNHICVRFPHGGGNWGVALNRPGNAGSRNVSLQGFLLLEEAESSFGTSSQSIEGIRVESLDDVHLFALCSRIKRQKNPVASIAIRVIEVRLGGGLQSAQALSILLQADEVDIGTLVVYQDIGEEGWRILARAIRPEVWRSKCIYVDRDGLAQAEREDIKRLIDAGRSFRIFKTLDDLQDRNMEASFFIGPVDNNWNQMEQYLIG